MRCPWWGGVSHGRPPSCPPQSLTCSPQGCCKNLHSLKPCFILLAYLRLVWSRCSSPGSKHLWCTPSLLLLSSLAPLKSQQVVRFSGSYRNYWLIDWVIAFYQSREKKKEEQFHDLMWRHRWFQCSSKPLSLNGRYNGLIEKTNGNGLVPTKDKSKP